jgi:uncharacterized membrane protein
LTAPQTNIQKGIVGRYRVIIKYDLENLKFDFENSGHKISVRTPIPLVLSGGTAMVDGFRDIFEEVRAEVGLPFQVSVVRMAKDPLHDVAKGCLLAAKMLY